jgi:response regulator NasT
MERPLKIIVADDEPVMRDYFQQVLQRMGHTLVGVAENGMELVDLAVKHRSDLVITDVRMPDMDGLEAAQRLAKVQSLPILLVSGCVTEIPTSVDLGDHSVMVLSKPIRRDGLATAMRKVVTKHRLRQTIREEASSPEAVDEDRDLVAGVVRRMIDFYCWDEAATWYYLEQFAARASLRIVDVARQWIELGAQL